VGGVSNWALVRDGVVENVIVVDDVEDPDFAEAYVADPDSDWASAINLEGIDPQPSIGWVVVGEVYVPPETLETDKATIVGDGVDAAILTYTNNAPNPPDEAEVVVNGQAADLALVGGTGQVAITSTNPGDVVQVLIGTVGAVIEVS
jgi:hypothetical protein